jgi:hypothetical protein
LEFDERLAGRFLFRIVVVLHILFLHILFPQ